MVPNTYTFHLFQDFKKCCKKCKIKYINEKKLTYEYIKNSNENFGIEKRDIYANLFILLYSNLVAYLYYLNVIL